MRLEFTVTVEINKIQVDERYYSFEYSVHKDGELVDEGEWQKDHGWSDDVLGFKKLLEDGYALEMVLQKVFG